MCRRLNAGDPCWCVSICWDGGDWSCGDGSGSVRSSGGDWICFDLRLEISEPLCFFWGLDEDDSFSICSIGLDECTG